MTISFEDRVAIVTGAGNGSSRAHAIGLAARGAKVVVNDLGAARDGSGGSSAAAEKVVEEIRAAGGQAMLTAPMSRTSHRKMELSDFRTVMDVHLMGSVHCTKAVWDIMREQNTGASS